jgi:hypothetical protein
MHGSAIGVERISRDAAIDPEMASIPEDGAATAGLACADVEPMIAAGDRGRRSRPGIPAGRSTRGKNSNAALPRRSCSFSGVDEDRTHNLLDATEALSQLSYHPMGGSKA